MHQGKAEKSLPQVFSQNQSPEELRGKLLYSITIPQLGIVANGLLDKTDPVDWILVDYIRRWELNKKAQTITKDGKKRVRINFKHLLGSLPILHYFKIHSKPPITRKLQKLEKLGLIETFKAKDNTLFARLTDRAWECYQTRLSEQIEDEISPPVSPREKHPISLYEKYPVPPREEQHNRESIENHNKESFKDNNKFIYSTRKKKQNTDPFKSNSSAEEESVILRPEHPLKGVVSRLVSSGACQVTTPPPNRNEAFDRLSLEQVKEILNASELYKKLKLSKTFVDLTPEQQEEADRILQDIQKKNRERFNGRLYE